MRRILREMIHDLTEARIHMWIILVALLAFILQTYLLQITLDIMGKQNSITLQMLELIVPSLGGYATLMLMQGLLDTEGGEIAFSFPRKHLYWGVIRQMRFYILYVVAIYFICKLITGIIRIDFVPIFRITLAQSFAVMAITFLGVILVKKVSVGLVILISFVGMQIMIGREFETLNWIYIADGSLPSQEKLEIIMLNSSLIGIFGWVVGQTWLRP